MDVVAQRDGVASDAVMADRRIVGAVQTPSRLYAAPTQSAFPL